MCGWCWPCLGDHECNRRIRRDGGDGGGVLQVMVRAMNADQTNVPYPNGREATTNLRSSYSVFLSEGSRIM